MASFDDFGILTAGQRAKLNELVVISDALSSGQIPDISNVTYSQAKQSDAFVRDENTLLGKAHRGAKYVMEIREAAALQAWKDTQ